MKPWQLHIVKSQVPALQHTPDVLPHDVIDRLRHREHAAYAIFVQVYSRKAMSLAVRILGDVDDAEDALQESFIKAWKNLDSFRAEAHIGTWFYRIVYTTCLNVKAAKKRKPEFDVISDDYYDPSLPDVYAQLDAGYVDIAVKSAMDELPQEYAVLVDLFYVQNCSYEQICEITNMPLGTVKTRLNRARTRLRKAVERKGL